MEFLIKFLRDEELMEAFREAYFMERNIQRRATHNKPVKLAYIFDYSLCWAASDPTLAKHKKYKSWGVINSSFYNKVILYAKDAIISYKEIDEFFNRTSRTVKVLKIAKGLQCIEPL